MPDTATRTITLTTVAWCMGDEWALMLEACIEDLRGRCKDVDGLKQFAYIWADALGDWRRALDASQAVGVASERGQHGDQRPN